MYVMYVMHVCMYVCMYVCEVMYVCDVMSVCMFVMYVCMYVGMYVCMCTSQFRPISLCMCISGRAYGDAVMRCRPLAANKPGHAETCLMTFASTCQKNCRTSPLI